MMIIQFLDKIVFDVCAGGTAGGAGWVEEHKYLEFRLRISIETHG
jgi:hypothetical protein